MNLQDYVEVECKFDEVVLISASSKASQLLNAFEEKVRGTKIMSNNQVFYMNIDGRNYMMCQIVGFLEEVVMAYCIEPIDKDVVIHARRFEKGNVAGKALFNIAKNVFAGKPRTWGMEKNLIKNTGRFIKGMTSPSPLGSNSIFVRMAGIQIEKIDTCLKDAIAEM
jgi:hypothetical protein